MVAGWGFGAVWYVGLITTRRRRLGAGQHLIDTQAIFERVVLFGHCSDQHVGR